MCGFIFVCLVLVIRELCHSLDCSFCHECVSITSQNVSLLMKYIHDTSSLLSPRKEARGSRARVSDVCSATSNTWVVWPDIIALHAHVASAHAPLRLSPQQYSCRLVAIWADRKAYVTILLIIWQESESLLVILILISSTTAKRVLFFSFVS